MRIVALVLLAVCAMLAGCVRRTPTRTASSATRGTPCDQVIPQCHAERLPDLTLTGNEKWGALGSVDGFDLSGVLSFDEGLPRAWTYSTHEQAKTVRVILGSADATKLRWGSGKRLFYGIDWSGECLPVPYPTPSPGQSPYPPCAVSDWGTAIDAKTGAFIVEGTG